MTIQLDLNSPTRVSPPLLPGDPIPWVSMASDIRPDFRLSTLGGRRWVMTIVDSLASELGRQVESHFLSACRRLRPFTSAATLVSRDPADATRKVPHDITGARYLFDPGGAMAEMFGVSRTDALMSIIVDERLRVLCIETSPEPGSHITSAFDQLNAFVAAPEFSSATPLAPVLLVPRIFEADLCQRLIAGYERHGGEESGFMVEADGRTVAKFDHSHKRRSDWSIDDASLVQACHRAIERRLVPEIRRAFQFEVTRIERNLVACYDSEVGGFFNRHRDNTTKGTAHRRFAVSINLNAESHEGGELVFPEFGAARYRPTNGGACVFSCSLLHEARPVTRGKRYVFVPFLYDEAAKRVREENLRFIDGLQATNSPDKSSSNG